MADQRLASIRQEICLEELLSGRFRECHPEETRGCAHCCPFHARTYSHNRGFRNPLFRECGVLRKLRPAAGRVVCKIVVVVGGKVQRPDQMGKQSPDCNIIRKKDVGFLSL